MLLSDPKKDKAYSVGIDASLTSFGVYCLPLNHENWYGWSLQSTARDGSDTSRVIALAKSVIDSLCSLEYPPAVLTFEDYGPIGRTSGKIAQRAEMCGIIKHYALTVLCIPVICIPPTSLKKFATGNGKASKEDMLVAANRMGFFTSVSDEADAYHAALFGSKVLNGTKTSASFYRTNP